MHTKHAGITDVGLVREQNEDNWCAHPEMGLFIVADGMGGHLGGGTASSAVVAVLPSMLNRALKGRSVQDDEVTATIQSTLCQLSNELRDGGSEYPELSGLGSTVVLLYLHNQNAYIAHLGDSRAYLLRKNKFTRLTNDHTIVQLLIDSGDIKPEEAASHPARGQLTRYVGMKNNPLPECGVFKPQHGDCVLLCTDGLTGLVKDTAIKKTLKQDPDLAACCRKLVDAANKAGGKDNITALLVSFQNEPERA